MDLIRQLGWRYAVKKFDPDRKLTSEQLETILESVRLSASAFGLQPYRLVVVDEVQVRESLVEHSMNQDKVLYASHLLVFAIRLSVDDTDIENHLRLISETRQTPRGNLAGLEQMLHQFTGAMSQDAYRNWATRQAYLALGNLLTVCAMLQVDACPMEGFVPAAYDRILQLDQLGLTATVIATLGFRAQDDPYARLRKVRMPSAEFIIRV